MKEFQYFPLEIVSLVRKRRKPYFRPTLLSYSEDGESCEDELLSLIQRCWAEDPIDRPDFNQIKSTLKRINKSVSISHIFRFKFVITIDNLFFCVNVNYEISEFEIGCLNNCEVSEWDELRLTNLFYSNRHHALITNKSTTITL